MPDLLSQHGSRLELSMRVIDVLALAAAGQLAGFIRFSSSLDAAAPVHSILLVLCSALAFLLFWEFGLYVSWRGRSPAEMYLRIAGTWGLVLLVGLFISFLMHHVGELSRLWLFYWFMTGTAAVAMVRWIGYSGLRMLRKQGLNSKSVVIVGYGAIGQEIHRRAATQDWYGYKVIAVYASQEDAGSVDLSSVQKIGTHEEIPDYVAEHHVDEIWIAVSMSASDQLQKLQYLLRNSLADIRWIPDTLGMQMLSNRVGDFLGFPAVDLNRPVSSGISGIAKSCFDKLFALFALLALSPLLVALAICIKATSPGPALFKQPRLGLNGRKFNMYKFRSMRVHQEHGVVTQATKDDPRITRIGAFLRKTSLDELPQFLNVLLGDMSIVGPRPHAIQHNVMYQDLLEVYMARHRVKPGITGWAQINGHRGETDTVDKMAKRVQYDLYYIRHWTMWMDIRIIIWTAIKGWSGKNAY